MLAVAQLRLLNTVHRTLLLVSGGRLGWHFAGMAVLELTTSGRRSGAPRSVMLTSPLQQGERIVLVASRGGDDRHPDWFLNLQAQPQVRVAFAGRPVAAMSARAASDAERAELWPQVIAAQPRYARYQSKTDRVIPLVLVEPERGS